MTPGSTTPRIEEGRGLTKCTFIKRTKIAAIGASTSAEYAFVFTSYLTPTDREAFLVQILLSTALKMTVHLHRTECAHDGRNRAHWIRGTNSIGIWIWHVAIYWQERRNDDCSTVFCVDKRRPWNDNGVFSHDGAGGGGSITDTQDSFGGSVTQGHCRTLAMFYLMRHFTRHVIITNDWRGFFQVTRSACVAGPVVFQPHFRLRISTAHSLQRTLITRQAAVSLHHA